MVTSSEASGRAVARTLGLPALLGADTGSIPSGPPAAVPRPASRSATLPDAASPAPTRTHARDFTADAARPGLSAPPTHLSIRCPNGKLLQTHGRVSPAAAHQRSSMFDGRWRTAVDRTTGPVGETLHRHGIN